MGSNKCFLNEIFADATKPFRVSKVSLVIRDGLIDHVPTKHFASEMGHHGVDVLAHSLQH